MQFQFSAFKPIILINLINLALIINDRWFIDFMTWKLLLFQFSTFNPIILINLALKYVKKNKKIRIVL